MNIHPAGAMRTEERHDRQAGRRAERQTDMTTPIAGFRNFAYTTKSIKLLTEQRTFQDAIPQECDTVSLGEWLQTFRSTVVLSS
jgi:hypothetical protein